MRTSRLLLILTCLYSSMTIAFTSRPELTQDKLTLFMHENPQSCMAFMDPTNSDEPAKCGTSINVTSTVGFQYPAKSVQGERLDANRRAHGQIAFQTAASTTIDMGVRLLARQGDKNIVIGRTKAGSFAGLQFGSIFGYSMKLDPAFDGIPIDKLVLEVDFHGTWIEGRVSYAKPDSYLELPTKAH